MKLGLRRNYHYGRAAIRHYANPSFMTFALAFFVIVQLHRLIVYSTNPVLLSVTSSPVSHSLAMAAVWILSSVDLAGAGQQ